MKIGLQGKWFVIDQKIVQICRLQSSIHDLVPQDVLTGGTFRQRTNNRYGLADEVDLSDDSA